ncbi:GNAT family N-acetyltransferase [Mycobacterium sp. SM1]|uniref:GNAT family N-acetyltransferase n=1 Tax=Mycobacterium sp. SM1 TaxID=2816243 RepID=UPI001BCDDC21|nr:GNAT family protein [Mycobacterium sp. SM1]MBS4730678.1 GNAT family N-acetyltransferase [Mycobacterium sp. SM1]
MTDGCVNEGINEGQKVRLLDGAEVVLRRLDRRDTDAVLELHRRLTAHEQYLRFFIPSPAYLETFADKVVECNQRQWALGAFESGRLIGVANYVVSADPGVAEVAVAVAHEDHLRGVATALLRSLAKIALDNGIHCFTADVLAENTAMLKVLFDAGWRYATQREGPVISLQIDLTQLQALDL